MTASEEDGVMGVAIGDESGRKKRTDLRPLKDWHLATMMVAKSVCVVTQSESERYCTYVVFPIITCITIHIFTIHKLLCCP